MTKGLTNFSQVITVTWCVVKNFIDTMIDIFKSFVLEWQILNYRFKIHGFCFSCITSIFLKYSFLGLERDIGDDSENWLTGSSKWISFWSWGKSVEGSNVGCLGGSITKETSQKKVVQVKNKLIIVVTIVVFKMGIKIIFSPEDVWALYKFDLHSSCVLSWELSTCF